MCMKVLRGASLVLPVSSFIDWEDRLLMKGTIAWLLTG